MNTQTSSIISKIIILIILIILAALIYFSMGKNAVAPVQNNLTATSTADTSDIIIATSTTQTNGGTTITIDASSVTTDTATDTDAQPLPVIAAITPSTAKIGSSITVTGQNLRGFEGDKNLWIVSSDLGIKGIIYGDRDNSTTTIHFKLADKYCSQDNSYSGKPCGSYLQIVPGAYDIYAMPWGAKSNLVHLVVTK